MSFPYRLAVVSGAVGLGTILWAVLAGLGPPAWSLPVLAAAAPVAVLAWVWGGLDADRLPGAALVGGGLLGPLLALVGHLAVGAFAVAFILGFAEAGRRLLEALLVDPELLDLLANPFVVLILINVAVVAPLVEEAAKGLGAGLAYPRTRREAFLAGVAAGVGFAVVENLLYAGASSLFGGLWTAVLVGRATGAAVHPLASGLVMLGWWEWRHRGESWGLLRGFLGGAAVHALWNGSVAVVWVAVTSARFGDSARALGVTALTYAAVLGVVMLGVLWRITTAVALDRPVRIRLDPGDARAMAAWVLLAASLLVPVTIMVLAFPEFYRGW